MLRIIFILSCTTILSFIVKNTYYLLKPHYPISTPYGTLLTLNSSSSNHYQILLNFIEKHTSSQDTIFYTDWEAPPLYVLSNRLNPSYYDSLIDLLALPSSTKEAHLCQQLINHPPKLIIHDPDRGIVENHRLYSYHQLTPLLNHCIETNFTPITIIHNSTIYVPR